MSHTKSTFENPIYYFIGRPENVFFFSKSCDQTFEKVKSTKYDYASFIPVSDYTAELRQDIRRYFNFLGYQELFNPDKSFQPNDQRGFKEFTDDHLEFKFEYFINQIVVKFLDKSNLTNKQKEEKFFDKLEWLFLVEPIIKEMKINIVNNKVLDLIIDKMSFEQYRDFIVNYIFNNTDEMMKKYVLGKTEGEQRKTIKDIFLPVDLLKRDYEKKISAYISAIIWNNRAQISFSNTASVM